jgi:hypothetical protein
MVSEAAKSEGGEPFVGHRRVLHSPFLLQRHALGGGRSLRAGHGVGLSSRLRQYLVRAATSHRDDRLRALFRAEISLADLSVRPLTLEQEALIRLFPFARLRVGGIGHGP